MKNFVELIQRVHQERFSVVMSKIINEKIPAAFLSLAPIEQAVDIVNKLRSNNLNIQMLITIDSTPLADLKTDFNVIHINKAMTMYTVPEYIFVTDDTAARVAIKNLSRCKTISIERGDTEFIYNTFMNHLTDLQQVYESFIDEESKKVFCGYWLGKISNKFGEYVFTKNAQYITAGFIPERGAILLEGGVYDGKTSAFFTDMGYKVYAFEMDKICFEKSQQLAKEKNFVLEHMGLGSFDGTLRYNKNGFYGNAWYSGGKDTAPVISLDTYVYEKKIPRVDFIKLDVEGAEYDTLRGARTIISRWKPILAISAYHKLDDFWTLMNFVKSLRPDYEFALRQFAQTTKSGAPKFYSLGLDPDVRNFNECVLFAR